MKFIVYRNLSTINYAPSISFVEITNIFELFLNLAALKVKLGSKFMPLNINFIVFV